ADIAIAGVAGGGRRRGRAGADGVPAGITFRAGAAIVARHRVVHVDAGLDERGSRLVAGVARADVAVVAVERRRFTRSAERVADLDAVAEVAVARALDRVAGALPLDVAVVAGRAETAVVARRGHWARRMPRG